MAKIIIDTEESSVQVEGSLHLEEYTNALLAMLTGSVESVKEQAVADDVPAEKVDKDLFDFFNERFARFLELNFPDIEMHPEITQEILQKESELVAERAAEIDE